MKQTLQRKFVRTAMTAVTALLLVLLVVINLANWYLVNQQTDHMLQTVLQSDHAPDIAGQPGRMGPRRSPGWREMLPQDMQEDIQETARHRILSMLALSAGGVALCWLGMLALVRVLARKGIEPVAVSMEKQRQFVTNAGHELKTPLAIILANTEAMELYQGESKWSRNIRAQTVRLSQLTQTLLTLAKMEEGADLPPAQTVDLSQLAEQALSAFQEAAALQNLTLRGEIAPGVTVPACREHLEQLLSILLDNRVKYTEPGGRVDLILEDTEGGACLQVRNAPARTTEEDLPRLFDRFYRGDPARTQKSGGCGIGLSAAQAIVTAWKGTISAAREGEDTVVFTVRF
ncbi:MAG: HAMP domain-containing sensor histidine kinase [Evtepia sp.]|nr:HAMP domain-containing sensor histidine kinase [Evtepia sp.]